MYNPLNRQIFLKEQVVKALEQACECYYLIDEDIPLELDKDLTEARETLLELKLEERKVKLKENLKRKSRKIDQAIKNVERKLRKRGYFDSDEYHQKHYEENS